MIAASPSMTSRVHVRVAPRTVRACATPGKPDELQDSVAKNINAVKAEVEGQVQRAQENMTNNTSFAQDARSSLEPRVADLRENQLTGLSNKEDIMSFTGPLPELLNGRLAMLGFTACMASEFVSHKSLWEQITTAPASIALAFAIFGVASIVPIIRGVDMNSLVSPDKEGQGKSGFTLTNELINGRAAMLGFAIILIFETVVGRPLFA